MNKQVNILRATKRLNQLIAEGFSPGEICVFAEYNDVGYYDIWIGADSRFQGAGLTHELAEHYSDIGSHAECEADRLARKLGVMSEREFDAAYSD